MYLWCALVVTTIVTLLFLTSNESNAAHSITLPQPTVKSAKYSDKLRADNK